MKINKWKCEASEELEYWAEIWKFTILYLRLSIKVIIMCWHFSFRIPWFWCEAWAEREGKRGSLRALDFSGSTEGLRLDAPALKIFLFLHELLFFCSYDFSFCPGPGFSLHSASYNSCELCVEILSKRKPKGSRSFTMLYCEGERIRSLIMPHKYRWQKDQRSCAYDRNTSVWKTLM